MCLWVVWDEAVSTYLPEEEESSKELLWEKKKSNFTAERPDKHYLQRGVKININSVKSYW